MASYVHDITSSRDGSKAADNKDRLSHHQARERAEHLCENIIKAYYMNGARVLVLDPPSSLLGTRC